MAHDVRLDNNNGPLNIGGIGGDQRANRQPPVRIENRHIDFGNPLGNNNPGSVASPSTQQKNQSLQTLRQRKVKTTKRKWFAGAAVVGAAGGTTLAVMKGAAIGAAIGSFGGPWGTAIGAGIGAACVLVPTLLAGWGIGKARAKSNASNITVDSLIQKYDPNGKKFQKLLGNENLRQNHYRNGIDDAGGLGVFFDPNPHALNHIPTDFTAQERDQMLRLMRQILNGRMQFAPPITKNEIERAAIVAARFTKNGNVGPAFEKHLKTAINKRLETHGQNGQQRPISGVFLETLFKTSELCSKPLTYGRNPNDWVNLETFPNTAFPHLTRQSVEGVEAEMSKGLAQIMASVKNGETISFDLLNKVRDKLVNVAVRNGLTAAQKRSIIKNICATVSHAVEQHASDPVNRDGQQRLERRLLRPGVLQQISDGFAKIATEVSSHNDRVANVDPDAQINENKIAEQFASMVFDAIEQKAKFENDSTFGEAVADGLVELSKKGLTEDQEKRVLGKLSEFAKEGLRQEKDISAEQVQGLIKVFTAVEKELAQLGQGNQLSDDQFASAERNVRKMADDYIKSTSPEKWTESNAKMLLNMNVHHQKDFDLRNEANNLQSAERKIDYQADQATEKFCNVVKDDDNLTVNLFTGHLRTAMNKSMKHTLAYKAAKSSLGSNSKLYSVHDVDPDMDRFATRMEHTVKNEFTKQEAIDAYNRLMSQGGPARSLIFNGHLLQKNSNLAGGNNAALQPAMEELHEHGVKAFMLALGKRAGMSKNEIEAEFQAIEEATDLVDQVAPKVKTGEMSLEDAFEIDDMSDAIDNNEILQELQAEVDVLEAGQSAFQLNASGQAAARNAINQAEADLNNELQ